VCVYRNSQGLLRIWTNTQKLRDSKNGYVKPSIDLHRSTRINRDYKRLKYVFLRHDRRHLSKLSESTQYETNIPSNTTILVTPQKSIAHCKTKVFHNHTIWHSTPINQQNRQQSQQPTPIPTYNHGLCLSTVDGRTVGRF
jgi:hypothetical protein